MSTAGVPPTDRFFPRFAIPVAAALVVAAAGVLVVRAVQRPAEERPAASGAAAVEEPGSVEATMPAPPAEERIPRFAFHLDDVDSVATRKSQPTASVAKAASRQVRDVLSDLYVAAFLDPAGWREGDHDAVWRLFDADAAGPAERDAVTVTLGPKAGAAYERVTPGTGVLRVSLLMGPSGQPVTAVATVRFTARATTTNGRVVMVVSRGEYFLRPAPGGWRIYGYEIERDDHRVGTP